MNKITILENKTLKLQNVLSMRVDLESESDELFDIEINKLNTYIQTHGAKQTGSSTIIVSNGDLSGAVSVIVNRDTERR